MGRFSLPIHAWNGGEISPRLYGRADIQKYDRAAEVIENFYIQAEGGLLRRSGSRFVKSIDEAVLVPFIYSTEQAYVLAFSEMKMHVFRDEGAVLESTQAIEDADTTNPVNIQITGHGYSTGNEIFIDSGSDMEEINGRFFTITVVDPNNFTLDNENGLAYGAWSAGGNVAKVFELATSYSLSDAQEFTYTQSADILYIAHKDHEPAKVSRTGHTSWSIDDIEFNDGPYLGLNATATTADPDTGAAGVTETLLFSAVEGINGGDGFSASDVGRLLRHEATGGSNDGAGWGPIDSINSTTSVEVEIKTNMENVASNLWRLGAWWTDNYPAAVSFAEGRLWWGGEPQRPFAIYGSESANYEGYAPSTRGDVIITDASAINYAIASNQVNNVLWMEVGRTLFVGTPGGVFPVQASSNNEPVTPTNINVPIGTSVGTAAIRPVRVANYLVYVDRTKRRLRGLNYSIQNDDYIADDLTRIADHVGSSPFSVIGYQLTPDSIIWCARDDGELRALTFVPEEEVFAWARHKIAGTFGSGGAVVESLAVIPQPSGENDQVWMIVKRTIDGNTVRYVEFLEAQFEPTDDIEDAFFVDSGLTYSGSSATVMRGLNHLEGETVQVLADGMTQNDKTVSGGSITLDTAATKVHIGLGYNSDLGTLRIDPPKARGRGDATGGSSQGLLKRIDRVILRYADTNAGKYGRDSSALYEMNFRQADDDLDEPPPLRSGDIVLSPQLGNDREGKLFFRQDKPLPFNLLSMTVQGQVGDQ